MHIRFADVDTEFMKTAVKAGFYTSETEVVRDAVRRLREQQAQQISVERLKKAVQVGLDDVAAGRVREMTPESWAEMRKGTLRNADKPPRYHDTIALPHDNFPTYAPADDEG